MTEIIKAGQRFARREIADDDARAELAHEKFKLELIGLKGGSDGNHTPTELDAEEASQVGGGVLTMYDNLDRRRRAGLDRPVPRPAPADHPADPGVQADALGRRVLAGRPEQRAVATDLRHRLGQQGRAQGLPEPAGGGRQARPPQARRGAGPVQLPGRDRLRPGGVPPQGRRCCGGRWRTTSRQRHIDEGFDYVGTPHISKDGLFHTSGHLPYYADGMFPPMELENAEYRLKAMNCPMHNLIYRSARTVVPGAAAAAVRVRHRLPIREVRRGARPDPGSRADPGRFAQLLHARAGARPRSSTC